MRFQLIQKCEAISFTSFIESVFSYITGTEYSRKRFWNAFNNLKRMGYIYGVVQIWDKNPLDDINKLAEPLYPLYVFDRHARETEPFLAHVINGKFKSEYCLEAFFSEEHTAEMSANVGRGHAHSKSVSA